MWDGNKRQRTVNVMWITSCTLCEHKAWPQQSAVPSSSGSRWAPWWGFRVSFSLLFRAPSSTQFNLSTERWIMSQQPCEAKAPLPQLSQPYNYRSHELWLNLWWPLPWSFSTPLCQAASHFKLHPKTSSVYCVSLTDEWIHLCPFHHSVLFSCVHIFSTFSETMDEFQIHFGKRSGFGKLCGQQYLIKSLIHNLF